MGRPSRSAPGLLLLAAVIAFAARGVAAAPPPANVVRLGGAIEALPGGRARARAILEIAPGYHVNAHVPRQAFLVPTDLTLFGGTFGTPSYPEPVERRFAFARGVDQDEWAGAPPEGRSRGTVSTISSP
ncbi:MAG: hypothetical protein ACKOCT_00815 [Alphaproteobacteria bacterium]